MDAVSIPVARPVNETVLMVCLPRHRCRSPESFVSTPTVDDRTQQIGRTAILVEQILGREPLQDEAVRAAADLHHVAAVAVEQQVDFAVPDRRPAAGWPAGPRSPRRVLGGGEGRGRVRCGSRCRKPPAPASRIRHWSTAGGEGALPSMLVRFFMMVPTCLWAGPAERGPSTPSPLAEQREGQAAGHVGLGQHRDARLLQDLVAGHLAGLGWPRPRRGCGCWRPRGSRPCC